MARIPWHRTVIYEAHVRGLTMLNREVPERLRGTFAGLAHDSVVEHLLGLGVTTVQLMPVLSFESEPFLAAHGLTNYWGYNTGDYFAAHGAYAAGDDPDAELAAAVGSLHDAGLEVVLDVVFNHTAAGALPADWYRESDLSGCGNTPDATDPRFADLVVRCLRTWQSKTGVDGFRFDLAAALARDAAGRLQVPGPLFGRIAADGQLSDLKLVVEPWDATPEGYALGRFGAPYAEWNDRFRDEVRDFWRGRGQGVRDLATRLAGSSDLVDSPLRSVNFVTAHDGFTLRDLVSYAGKHNQANGEEQRDGHDDNRSDNLGVEGDTGDFSIIEARQARARALLSTLLLARGVPMLRMGDELGHTQSGNNNAYCQDNELSWLRWDADPGWDMRSHVRHLISERAGWVGAEHLCEQEVQWFGADGRTLTERDWQDTSRTRLGMRLGARTLWLDATTAVVEWDTA